MAISKAAYIDRSDIQDRTLRYRWDDWNFDDAEEPVDPELLQQLQKLSLRANIAFAVATTEWMVFRFERMLDDPLPFDYLEAAWAQIVDPHYALEWWDPLRDEEWVGPVKGPIREAVAWVINIMRDVDETKEHPAEMGASLSKLTEHVLSDAAPYLAWRERALQRLQRFYPFDPADPLGDVVPREALDPALPFQPEQTESLVNRFLAGLNVEENDFLQPPEDMLEEGFEGTPYVFNIAEDRRKRIEE
jgi:hypothetical protein